MKRKRLNFNRYTDEDLDRLSEVTEQDIVDAHQTFVTAVSKRFKNLILAVRVQLFGDDNV
jgi:hypothetical protein